MLLQTVTFLLPIQSSIHSAVSAVLALLALVIYLLLAVSRLTAWGQTGLIKAPCLTSASEFPMIQR
jgi:hypothetical protein